MDQWRRQHLIELFLPLTRGDGAPVGRAELDEIKHDLAARFGGVTAYLQSPAEGLWGDGQRPETDRIVVMEVMADGLEQAFWTDLQRQLAQRFQQEEILIRATSDQAADEVRLQPCSFASSAA